MLLLTIALDIIDHFLNHPEQAGFILGMIGFFTIVNELPKFLMKLKLAVGVIIAMIIFYYVGNFLYFAYTLQ